MTKYLTVLILSITLISCEQQSEESQSMQSFRLDQVRLLDGPFKRAQQTDLQYILEMDVDKLLAPYLIEAGLDPVKPGYGNWEGSGLNGHIGGHYLSALSMMYAATGSDTLDQEINYMLAQLKQAQDANLNGYLAGIPDGEVIWEEISAGDIRADFFSLNDRWVPLYNIHKIFAGLRDAYWYADKELAFDMWKDLSDWWMTMTANLSDEQIQQMLKSEHGGLNEVFADLYAETGDQKYLDMAQKLSHQVLLNPLLENKDQLTGMHANTQIPKVIGYERVAAESSNRQWHDASVFFWNTVVNNRSIAIGGNSVREHFHSADNFRPMITSEQGPETCNTYNMMRLSKELFLADEETKYLDYYERAQYNHILSSQHPDGGFVYFTPARPRHYRVYSQPHQAMWCCVGSGIENHTKYGELIYTHKGDDLYVNLFIPSTLNWSENGIKVSQKTQFPEEEASQLTISLESPKQFTLSIRVPDWIDGTMSATVADETFNQLADGYLTIDRTWQDGDVVEISLPMQLTYEQLPDSSNWVAFKAGPVVLAAVTDTTDLEGLFADDSRMGHVSNGEFYSIDKAPVVVSAPNELLQHLTKVTPTNYQIDDLYGTVNSLELVPFYSIHEARYMLYWPFVDSAGLQQMVAETAAKEKERLALRKITVDQVTPGEQQPESEHGFQGEDTFMGYSQERYWRAGNGWFSYSLSNQAGKAKYLRVQYDADQGNELSIQINDQELEVYQLDQGIGEQYLSIQGLKNMKVTLSAPDGKWMPRIYDVRLLSEKPH